MTGFQIAVTALVAVLTGFGALAVVQLGVIMSYLGDLKAYTMTQISLLTNIDDKQRKIEI